MPGTKSRALRQMIAQQNASLASTGGVPLSGPGGTRSGRESGLPDPGSGSPVGSAVKGTLVNAGVSAGAGAASSAIGSSALGGTGVGSALMSLLALFCWAAEVYFPVHSKDWWNARLWIQEGWSTPAGDAFRLWYHECGEEWAEELKGDPELREAMRPFFEWCRDQGEKYNTGGQR